jgi:hypothetical protein
MVGDVITHSFYGERRQGTVEVERDGYSIVRFMSVAEAETWSRPYKPSEPFYVIFKNTGGYYFDLPGHYSSLAAADMAIDVEMGTFNGNFHD